MVAPVDVSQRYTLAHAFLSDRNQPIPIPPTAPTSPPIYIHEGFGCEKVPFPPIRTSTISGYNHNGEIPCFRLTVSRLFQLEDSRTRLEATLANERPIARGETHRAAVVAIQYALADLNQSYLVTAEIDGFFGPRTHAAVECFRRRYGLVADGIVGRQTMTQLDTVFCGEVLRKPVGEAFLTSAGSTGWT